MRRMIAALVAVVAPWGDPAVAATPGQMAEIRAGASNAKSECEPLIHFDTLAFEPCVGALVDQARRTPHVQLGMLYAGYVSALHYAHGGLPGARQTAWRFLQRLSPLQRRLEVDGRALCETLPGNCEIRVAATEAMLKAGPPPPGRIPQPHRH